MKNPKTDPMDYDGMGDFSRFRKATTEYISLENSIKKWLKHLLGLAEKRNH